MVGQSLEERVSAVEIAVASLQTLPGEFAAFRVEVRERFEQIDRRFEQIDARFREVDDRFTRIEARITHESEYLYARMRMLHESLIERIERLGEGSQHLRSDAPKRRRKRTKR